MSRAVAVISGYAATAALVAFCVAGWLLDGSPLSTATGRSRVAVTLLLAAAGGAAGPALLTRLFRLRK